MVGIIGLENLDLIKPYSPIRLINNDEIADITSGGPVIEPSQNGETGVSSNIYN